jgi:hypothetical protein
VEILRVLVQQGAGTGMRGIEGKTALDIATEKGYGVITEILRDGADERTLVCSNLHTGIYYAAESCDFENRHRSLNVGVSIETATENITTDATPEVKLQIHQNRQTVIHTEAESGSYGNVAASGRSWDGSRLW